MPKSDVNREHYLHQVDRQLAETDGTVIGGRKISAQKHEMLQRLLQEERRTSAPSGSRESANAER